MASNPLYVVLYFDEDTQQWESTDHSPGWDIRKDHARVLAWARTNEPRPKAAWGQIRLRLQNTAIMVDARNDGTRPLL